MALDRLSDLATDDDFLDALPPGTALQNGRYRITRVLNCGGFGITYLATDLSGQPVVIKECFASALCRRSGQSVVARSRRDQIFLDKVSRSFLSEARFLAKLAHPSVAKVRQVFEENATAYMVLDHMKGNDLLDVIEDEGRQLSVDEVVAIAKQLVTAIGYVHQSDVLHCDISPDNIFLTEAGTPVLIDFGAARNLEADSTRSYTGLSMVKDGYSPHEQYLPGSRIGPTSDIYSLAASLYHLISGVQPATCQSRIAALADRQPDPVRPLAGNWPGFPAGFLESIDKAMSVMQYSRFETAEDWLAVLASPPAQAKARPSGFLSRVMSFAAL
jgi:serine/threonine protein kinase